MLRLLRKDSDLLLVLALAVATVAITQTASAPGLWRTLLSTAFVFICPGYAFTRAVFGGSLSRLYLLTFTLGMSIVIAIIGGVLLNLTPLGLQTTTWIGLISLVIVINSGVALLRRVGVSAAVPDPSLSLINTLQFRHALIFSCALAICIGALFMARVGAFAQQSTYTQLWIQPDGADAFLVGVRNRENSIVRYNLEVKFGDFVVQEWPEIVLQPGDTWQSRMQMPATLLKTDWIASKVVSASLYRLEDANRVYRFVTLHLDG